jgi:hypothetical protein
MNTVILLVLLLVLLYIFYNNKVESFTNLEMQNYPAMLKENCRINKKLYRQLRKNNKFRCQNEGNTQRDTINNKTLCYDDTGKEINARLDMISNCAIADKQELITKDNLPFDTVKMMQQRKPMPESKISEVLRKKGLHKISRKDRKVRTNSSKSQKSSKVSSKSQKLSTKNSRSPKLSKSSRNSSKSPKTEKIVSLINKSGSKEANPQDVFNSRLATYNYMTNEGPEFINKFYLPSFENNKNYGSYANINNSVEEDNKYKANRPYDDVSINSDNSLLYQLNKK